MSSFLPVKSKPGRISVRGARAHNLKSVDLDIPYYKLVAFCGVSGSGKSSLALDVLYAEGQRRYIESFSAYARQFLEKLERPDVDRVEGAPPAVAVTSRPLGQMSRSTVGTATETSDYLRLLFSKIGTPYCQSCGREVRRDSPQGIVDALNGLPEGTRVLVAFSPSTESLRASKPDFEAEWKEKGFRRGVALGESFNLDDPGGFPIQKYAEARLLYLAAATPSDEEEFAEYGLRSSDDDTDFDGAKNDGELDDERLDEVAAARDVDDETDEFDAAFADGVVDDLGENEADEESAKPKARRGRKKTADDEENDEENGFESGANDGETKTQSRLLTIDPDGEDGALLQYLRRRNEIKKAPGAPPIYFVVDRAKIGKTSSERLFEAVETALAYGDSRCWVFAEGDATLKTRDENDETVERTRTGTPFELDGERWTLVGFSRRTRCEDCGVEFPSIEPKLFSFNSPLGACPCCEGFGNLMALDFDLIFPNKKRSIHDGAVAPWNSAAYRDNLKRFLAIADELGVRTRVPFSELTRKELNLLLNGSRRLGYEGLNGFFIRLQKQKYKMHIRVFLSRWRCYRTCPMCDGARLRQEALAVKIGGKSIHDLSSAPVSQILKTLDSWELSPWKRKVGKIALDQTRARLKYLEQVGLGYLTLDRPMKTLSSGEQRRVSLTSTLGSNLVDMLYVLDEPTIGLHPQDTERLLESIEGLRDRGNTVVVVEHDETILEAADRVVEIGPEAGQGGGRVVFEGTIDEMKASPDSLTGSYLSGRRVGGGIPRRRVLDGGFLELVGASGRNLKNVNAVFPLGVLCVVAGVSGAGKSSLVQETLYPALCAKLATDGVAPKGLPYEKLLGYDQLDEVALIDQSPIGRSPRSNPVTYLKIFDDIRSLYAETPDAKAAGYNAGYFSFNVDGGRCNACKGEGFLAIDMQFMADVYVRCPQCNGRRYQRNILDITYRGRNIAETLDMTAREAFSFFRGQPKIQQKLKRLCDVGLDYLRLGQPANTLSGGESQRLKLAARLSDSRKGPCLFILDEPTTGLHFADVVQLLDGFNALLETGNSLIVVEHNLQTMRAADYIIELGPGAADEGGTIIAEGTPEQIAQNPDSKTGRFLAKALAQR
ncbi:MAG: excinuclease ABC subunit UvrA [Thermoguttaceae bacterium]|nr:excinuclease ABC subunit UvrA [Thermoguttaceae bacterium]